MPGNNNPEPLLYIMDNSTISQIFRSFYRNAFPSFWEHFDASVQHGTITSVRHVRLELENARHPAIAQAPRYLSNLNGSFFDDPTEQEQALVRDMMNDTQLSAAANRWHSKSERGTEDADPYIVAKVRASMLAAAVVTEESQDPVHTASIYAVCHYCSIPCFNLEQMMHRLGWRF